MDIQSNPSPNYTAASQSMAQYGVPRTFQHIVLHWWGDPAKKPTLQGTVNWLKNPASQVSANYVVSGKTIVKLVSEADIAWHARQANPKSIGIEIDPNTPPGTYETVQWLCADIARRRGLKANSTVITGHKTFVNTACPGTIDIARIIREVAVILEQGGGGMADMYKMKSGQSVDLSNRASNVVLADTFDEVINQKTWEKKADVEKRISENYVTKESYNNAVNALTEYKKTHPDTPAPITDPAAVEKLRKIKEAIGNDPILAISKILES